MTLALHGKSRNRQWLLVAVALLAIFASIGAGLAAKNNVASATDSVPVSGDGVVPQLVLSNPSCQDIGYSFGFKIQGDYNRTVTLTSANGELTGGAPQDPFNTITVSSADNVYFNWSSTLGIDAVIVKGGENANAYVYVPEDYGDTGLAAPLNPNNSKPYGLSHIEFCYDYEKLASSTTTDLHDADHISVPLGSEVPFNSVIHDSATVTGTGATPTGTVVFEFFSNGTCTGTAVATSGALALAGGTVDATGFAQGPLTEGTYSFLATYSGDGTYDGSTATCEPFSVAARPQAIVSIAKTAAGSFTRTHEWEITKTVLPTSSDMFTGDTQEVEWEVEVTKTTTDSDFVVSGQIFISNAGPGSAEIENLTDAIAGTAISNCQLEDATPVDPVAGTVTLAEGDSITCDYTADLGDSNPGPGNNTASVDADELTIDSPQVPYDFEAAPTVVGYDEVTVEDSNEGTLGTTNASTSWKYDGTFTCDADEGQHDNTATIVETGQTADASVTIDCWALNVTKAARTSFDQTCEWDIDKTSETETLAFQPGESAEVEYTVELTVDCENYSNWQVRGRIWVANPAPIDAVITSVNDVISPDIAATVTCPGVSFPHTLAAGATLECGYSASLPDGDSRTNTATATLQNHTYSPTGEATPNGTTNFTGSAAVTFGSPANRFDECVEVSDDQYGDLGILCARDEPLGFTYKITIDADDFGVCTEGTFTNVASFVTNDTETTGEDDHDVAVTVQCEVTFCKFYDDDLSGDWSGLNEEWIVGWKITVNDVDYYTGSDGCVTVSIDPGTEVSATEFVPAGWIPTTDTTIIFTAEDIAAGVTFDFGNVCLGEGGGHTLGFWSNKNGQRTMSDDGSIEPELTLLRNLNLRNADGSNFNPNTYAQFRTWLLGASATNMAYMLSAQLAAMELNVEAGFVDASSFVWNGSAFVTIQSVMDDANAALGADGHTPSGDPNRSTQEALKNTLDRANNNLNFLQDEPCSPYRTASPADLLLRLF